MKPIRERKVCVCVLKPPDLLWDLNIRDRFKPTHVIAVTELGSCHTDVLNTDKS